MAYIHQTECRVISQIGAAPFFVCFAAVWRATSTRSCTFDITKLAASSNRHRVHLIHHPYIVWREEPAHLLSCAL